MIRSKDILLQTFKTHITKLPSKFSEMYIPSKRIWWESYREMLHPLESFPWLTYVSAAWPDHLSSVSNQTAIAQFLATSFYCLPPSLPFFPPLSLCSSLSLRSHLFSDGFTHILYILICIIWTNSMYWYLFYSDLNFALSGKKSCNLIKKQYKFSSFSISMKHLITKL